MNNSPFLPEFTLIRANRRTISIQITPQGQVVVRCPRFMPTAQVEDFLRSKRQWIAQHLARIAAQPRLPLLTTEEIRILTEKAMAVIPRRVEVYAPLVGVNYGTITIRNQRSRWGSCSGRGNLNFNCLLMLVPEEVLDYVVVHELCHRKEMNHSPKFWAEVERVMPDYGVRRAWLKDNGGGILGRMPGHLLDGKWDDGAMDFT
ncbi:MAG: M48 family metallopeptidase [Ruminococcaceae bacterium]|nr:M48 family metallopeptidase [Oscillospiraceae bacterium]